ncbi:MAG: hypothetical protein AB7U95_24180 [Reyranella sp.]
MSQAHVEMDSLANYETYVGRVLAPSAWASIDQPRLRLERRDHDVENPTQKRDH